jgi:hypothetical protein
MVVAYDCGFGVSRANAVLDHLPVSAQKCSETWCKCQLKPLRLGQHS